MVRSSQEVVLKVVSPSTAPSRQVLRSYMDEMVSRYYGRPATDDEIDLGLSEGPSDALSAPEGLFVVAEDDGTNVGCVGLRFLPNGTGEVKRLFVVPGARRRGLGTRLMIELEMLAAANGLVMLRLDTRHDLVEARRLYARLGYREVAPFDDGPYADHWLSKDLTK